MSAARRVLVYCSTSPLSSRRSHARISLWRPCTASCRLASTDFEHAVDLFHHDAGVRVFIHQFAVRHSYVALSYGLPSTDVLSRRAAAHVANDQLCRKSADWADGESRRILKTRTTASPNIGTLLFYWLWLTLWFLDIVARAEWK